MDLTIRTKHLIYLPTSLITAKITGISIKAMHESFLLEKFDNVNLELAKLRLTFAPIDIKQKTSNFNYIPSQFGISGQKPMFADLAKHFNTLNQILSNKYSGFIKSKVEAF